MQPKLARCKLPFSANAAMIEIGKGGHRKVKSYRLSRYAYLLISMSLSSKKEISISIQLSKKLG